MADSSPPLAPTASATSARLSSGSTTRLPPSPFAGAVLGDDPTATAAAAPVPSVAATPASVAPSAPHSSSSHHLPHSPRTTSSSSTSSHSLPHSSHHHHPHPTSASPPPPPTSGASAHRLPSLLHRGSSRSQVGPAAAIHLHAERLHSTAHPLGASESVGSGGEGLAVMLAEDAVPVTSSPSPPPSSHLHHSHHSHSHHPHSHSHSQAHLPLPPAEPSDAEGPPPTARSTASRHGTASSLVHLHRSASHHSSHSLTAGEGTNAAGQPAAEAAAAAAAAASAAMAAPSAFAMEPRMINGEYRWTAASEAPAFRFSALSMLAPHSALLGGDGVDGAGGAGSDGTVAVTDDGSDEEPRPAVVRRIKPNVLRELGQIGVGAGGGLLVRPKPFWERPPLSHVFKSTFLVVLGGTVGLLSWVLSMIIYYSDLTSIRYYPELVNHNKLLWFLLYFVHGVVFVFISLWLTITFAPGAAGSGVPEIKSILSGVTLRNFLSLKTGVIKYLATCTSVGSGAVVGVLGSLVHLGALTANQMTRLPWWRPLRSEFLWYQSISAGVAGGLSALYGGPIGGVLFAIESTSTYFPSRNYWLAFVAAVPAAVVFRPLYNRFILHQANLWAPIAVTDYKSLVDSDFDPIQGLLCAMLGVIGGVLGAVFVKLNEQAVIAWRRLQSTHPIWKSPYWVAFLMLIVWAVWTFPGFYNFMGRRSLNNFRDLVNGGDLDSSNPALRSHDWDAWPGLYFNLINYGLSRYMLAAVTLILPMPCGLFLPCFVFGAGIGRVVGEVARQSLHASIIPGSYAIVGASALGAGATHAMSSALIMLELTGELNHVIPVLLGTVIAVAVAGKLNVNIYDRILLDRGLPYLPDLKSDIFDIEARDIMNEDFYAIPLAHCTRVDLAAMLQVLPESQGVIPVINNWQDRRLEGMCAVDDIRRIVSAPLPSDEAYSVPGSDDDDDGDTPGRRPLFDGGSGSDEETATGDVEHRAKRLGRVVLPVQPITVHLLPDTGLSQIHILFISMRLTQAFVVAGGAIVGIVNRQDLEKAIVKRSKPAFLYRLQLLSA